MDALCVSKMIIQTRQRPFQFKLHLIMLFVFVSSIDFNFVSILIARRDEKYHRKEHR